MFAKIFKFHTDGFQRMFIKINDSFIWKKYSHRFKSKNVLLLLPHCLQLSLCKYRITFDQDNCIRCGKCDIAELLRLRDKYGIKMAIATGGTLARKIIKDTRPDFILAVACEQDLSMGIYEVTGIPVFGVLNKRPNGPCVNTGVSVDKIEDALKNFIKK